MNAPEKNRTNYKVVYAYLLLVLVQGLHSIEEYSGKLWENFPPATYLCSLISDDLRFGFLVINIGLFVFGIVSWWFVVRKGRPGTYLLIGIWIFIEITNGIGHPIWSIMQKDYTPGVFTAPVLLVGAIALFRYARKANALIKN